MDIVNYLSQIHFASLFFLGLATAVAAAVVAISWFFLKPRAIPHDLISFWGTARDEHRLSNFRWWLFRIFMIMPYFILAAVVLAAGNPIHQNTEIVSQKRTPYVVILDTSGSTDSASAFSRDVPLSFDETVLNAFRTALLDFVNSEKHRAEFFLILYSDTPYAARYFAGGKEADTQIAQFLENLPREIIKRRDASRRFYLEGTHTGFAIEAAARYRLIFSEEHSQSVLIILTDFEDPDIYKTAKAIDSLIDSGLNRKVYMITLPKGTLTGASAAPFEQALKYPEQVRILKAESAASLHAVFAAISAAEKPFAEIKLEYHDSDPLQHLFIYAALAGMFLFVILQELIFRKVP